MNIMQIQPLAMLKQAILPVLWSLFPNHRYLLEASFHLTPNLIQNGYA